MSRISVPAYNEVPEGSRPRLDAVKSQLGTIPNLFRLIGHSPAALEGFLGLNAALGKTLDAKARERIALAVAEVNGCDYCLSAHSYLASNLAGLGEAEISANRRGHSHETRADAVVTLARKIALTRGRVEDVDLVTVRQLGFTDAQLVEIIVNVALNFLTNIVNNVADTQIDFPVVRAEAP